MSIASKSMDTGFLIKQITKRNKARQSYNIEDPWGIVLKEIAQIPKDTCCVIPLRELRFSDRKQNALEEGQNVVGV